MTYTAYCMQGIADGTVLVSGNYGSTFFTNNGGTHVADTVSGVRCAKFINVSGLVEDARFPGFSNNSEEFRVRFSYSATPGAELTFANPVRNATGNVLSFRVSTSNILKVYDQGGTVTTIWATALTPGNTYDISGWCTAGTTTSNGAWSVKLLNGGTSTVLNGPVNSTGATNTGTVAFTGAADVGVPGSPAYAATVRIFNLQLLDGSAAHTLTPVVAPTAAFTSSNSGFAASFDGSTSAVNTTGPTLTSYAWTFGDGGTGTGVTPSHTYAAAGTYTVGLIVTDSNGLVSSNTTHSVTVSVPTAAVNPVAVDNAVGFTAANASTILTCITDSDPTTYAISASSPTAATFKVTLGAHVTPAPGTDQTVTVELDATGAGSGSASAKLYEGSTLRASAAGQALAVVAAGSTMSNLLTFTFLAGSIANVTDWSALHLELTLSAT
jgi:PKD repeat protein